MAKNFVLYRALHDWDDSSSGIDLTDRYANLSIKEHVERGGFRVYKRSQYISTTRDLPHALRWVSEDKSALAIILCRYLHPRVRITDISEGYPGVSWKYGKFVSMHEEHLVEPFINPSAVRICTYDELINIYRGRYHPKFLQEMSRSGRKSFLRGIRIQFSLRCCYCGGHGHDIECGHCCQEYEEQFCDRCNEYGHDCDGSDYDESDSDDQGWDEPYCYHCDEYGHDCDGSDDEDQGEEPFCYRCNEYGHDCNGFSDGDQGEEEPFCSSCNEYGHDCDGSDDEDQGGYGLFVHIATNMVIARITTTEDRVLNPTMKTNIVLIATSTVMTSTIARIAFVIIAVNMAMTTITVESRGGELYPGYKKLQNP